MEEAADLNLEACIGFTGKISDGLHVTPCGGYVVYPLGSVMVVRALKDGHQTFLHGHTLNVSCVSMSRDGTRLATGQTNHAGVKADVIVWDLSAAIESAAAGKQDAHGALLHRLRQHMANVQALDFSFDGRYLATLGGQDDNSVVVWDVAAGKAICGAPAATDSALTVKWLRKRNDRLVTAGNYHLRVWAIDVSIPKMHAMDAKMGAIRRVIQSIDISHDDKVAYCGTKTGDLLKFTIDRNAIQSFNDPDTVRPTLLDYSRCKFGRGVRSVCCILNPTSGNTNVVVGAGDGTVCFVNPTMHRVSGFSSELSGAVTSIAATADGSGYHVGTDLSNRYWLTQALDAELRGTCHHSRVNDVVFPEACPDLFITCSVADIRVWNAKLRQELLRIQVPNLECNCVGVTSSGSAILSGWSDGKIRAFFPESGKLKFVISDAHGEGVTALALAHDDDTRPPWRVISGGHDGRVRVWNVTSSRQSMAISWKEHRGPVTCLKVSRDNSQCVSGSADGSCIVWDLIRGVRAMAMFEPTVFAAVLYHPDESQYLTCGSNHKITYWDACDGTAIRVVTGGAAEMNALDVEPSGERFASGGGDALVKVWHYDDGVPTAVGRGHSGPVNAVSIAPDQSTIVSVGEEGGIFIWRMPAGEARGPVA